MSSNVRVFRPILTMPRAPVGGTIGGGVTGGGGREDVAITPERKRKRAALCRQTRLYARARAPRFVSPHRRLRAMAFS